MQTFRLEFEENASELYVASLARGILEGIKSGALKSETGIWSLGRPLFKRALAAWPISPELRNVLEGFDELSALSELGIDPGPTLQKMTDVLDQCQHTSNIGNASLVIRATST